MAILLAAGKLLAQNQPGYQGPMGWGMMGSGWGVFMMIFMVLFWGLIIVGIILLVRYLFPASGARPSNDALEILKQRYAKGEIQRTEFEEKKSDLTS